MLFDLSSYLPIEAFIMICMVAPIVIYKALERRQGK
jgi:hypothetical protein